MSDEKQQTPFGDMFTLWQKMVWEGFEMMLKAPAFYTGLGKAFESSTAVQEQIQKGIQASLKATRLPTVEDLRGITEGLSAMQAQLEVMKNYMGAVEAAGKVQEEWRKGIEVTIQRLLAYQAEGQRAFQAWTKQVEDRLRGLQGFWEEGAKRWEEGLRQAAAFAETGQRSLEELSKAVWDISKKSSGIS